MSNPVKVIAANLESSQASRTRLYLVTRDRKKISARTKPEGQYEFTLFQAGMDEAIQEDFFQLAKDQITRIANSDDFSIREYAIISDDSSNEIFTYNDSSESPTFCKEIFEQLNAGVDIRPLTSLYEVDGKLWAFCIQVLNLDGSYTLTITRIFRGKITVDANSQIRGTKRISAMFRTTDSILTPLKFQAINFDRSIDCVYSNRTFYILKKHNFEQLVVFEDQFKEIANDFISLIERTSFFDGLDIVLSASSRKPSVLKRLANLARSSRVGTIDSARIKKMLKTAREFGLAVKVNDGRIVIENDSDVDAFIKLLDDYYLRSDQTGMKYGSYAKQLITS